MNHVRLAGDVCVRLLKNADFESDLWTESVAVPVLVTRGVKTPELIAFDADRDCTESVVTIYRRVCGEVLGGLASVPDLQAVYLSVAHQARLWSARIAEVPDPENRLDKPHVIDLTSTFARQFAVIPEEDKEYISRTIQAVSQYEAPATKFVHWDLHAHNLVVRDGTLEAVLDWGDCGFGNPAINFTCFPAEWLPEVLTAFGDTSPEMIAAAIGQTLGYAMNAIHVENDPTTPLHHTGRKRWASFRRLRDRSPGGIWDEILQPHPKNYASSAAMTA